MLLRGVNDDADALVELSERLFAAGILPYYLHMPDAVAGTAHFDVSEAQAKAPAIAGWPPDWPGYLMPRLVRETPGKPAKEMLGQLIGSDLRPLARQPNPAIKEFPCRRSLRRQRQLIARPQSAGSRVGRTALRPWAGALISRAPVDSQMPMAWPASQRPRPWPRWRRATASA